MKTRTRATDEWEVLYTLDKCIAEIKNLGCHKVRGNDGYSYTSSKAVGRLANSLRNTADKITTYSRKYTK